MKDSQGVEHYGDVWPLTGNLWEGVCDCGYKTLVRMTPGNAKQAIEYHVERKTGHYVPAQVHEPTDTFGPGEEWPPVERQVKAGA